MNADHIETAIFGSEYRKKILRKSFKKTLWLVRFIIWFRKEIDMFTTMTNKLTYL